ncbi:hypothetical protein ROE7235_00875 [Roseibaca ekhonensis]|jgi:hypothetical protein|uniref:Uncharacterized protein n=1 Tax=Roseinatronobacter ekhonensis TaxID=254356 RepID=A0A3B0M6U3_9RHOB|nr:hypothetical protein [Roseibaca ekhonensis]SUZ31140.1 hypothetical protein ROE7235_00875 [Roseibaca ekhonensis]
MTRFTSKLLVPFTLLMIAAGLWQVGGPGQARMEQRDDRRMQDLQNLAAYLICDAREAPQAHCGTQPRQTDRFTQEPFTISETQVCANFEQPERIAELFGAQVSNGCLALK